MLECIIHHVLSYSNSCLYWCLKYMCEGIFDLHIYVEVMSLYPQNRGVTVQAYALTSSICPECKLMVKKFATGLHESRLYSPTTSTELSISSWSSLPWFLSPFLLFIFSFLSFLYQLKIWIDWRCSGRVFIRSLRLTLWSSGILRIVRAVRLLSRSRLSYIHGYIF